MAPPYRFVSPPAEYPGPRYMPSGRVLEHHLVYWRNTGQVVPDGFVVHHRDDVGTHNAFENLELIQRAAHTKLHHPQLEEDIKLSCALCGTALKRQTRDVRSKNRQGQSRFFCSSAHAALAGHAERGVQSGKHGTSSQYGKGCRCELCRAYKAQRYRSRRVTQTGAVS